MPASFHLEVEFEHPLDGLALKVAFRTDAPWTVLFGPSGSGKSTILRAIAGLLRPDSGRIVIAGQVVFDSRQNIWVPSHRRMMRWSPQRAMLVPRKTVAWNLRFGNSASAAGSLQEAGRHFRLRNLGAPSDRLSGGERQRLAVVRAAASARHRLLLLDEPFAGIDASVRTELIADLRSWLGPAPVVSVTHDVGEAFLLQADVVRIENGEVVAQGPAASVLAAQRTQLRTWLD